MNMAVENGDLDKVKFLHNIGAKCTKHAMDLAAGYGRLEIVTYLHSIGAK